MSEHPFTSTDPAVRLRALRESMTAKSAIRPKADSQGRQIEQSVAYRYDDHGQLIGPDEAPA